MNDEQNPNVIVLDEPIQRPNGESITTITLRQPKAGELRGLSIAQLLNMEVSAVITVLPRITTPTLLPHDAANLSLPDLSACATAIGYFFVPRQVKAQLQQTSPSATE